MRLIYNYIILGIHRKPLKKRVNSEKFSKQLGPAVPQLVLRLPQQAHPQQFSQPELRLHFFFTLLVLFLAWRLFLIGLTKPSLFDPDRVLRRGNLSLALYQSCYVLDLTISSRLTKLFLHTVHKALFGLFNQIFGLFALLIELLKLGIHFRQQDLQFLDLLIQCVFFQLGIVSFANLAQFTIKLFYSQLHNID
ncbi:hypothetical protein BpHYR1_012791 [Brachionus plicatilis]|uniref:Uncharacterized protein n=1 Tax=Brachionus plicatilis TaxID=10195 RepID=A0A3M7P2F1_BRAPC|nr:hypothetical protein BpHYR1_012791 [Brachionus plicatilis]